MEMISYWKNYHEIHYDDGLVLIVGWYDHKNQNNGGVKSLGVHWGNYPQSRGVLSPCVIPEATRAAILSGLLHQAVLGSNRALIEAVTAAIDFFNANA